MLRDHSDLTFNYPIKALHKEPFGYIEKEELKSKKTIVIVVVAFLYLSLHPFVPWSTFFSSQACISCELSIERWRIEVVEAQVEDSVSPVHRCADRGCHLCNL